VLHIIESARYCPALKGEAMINKTYDQYSEQEKAIIVATCGELEGVLSGISIKHELKVIPAYLFEEMTDTIAALKARCSELEGRAQS
jgi:glutamine amidotransferase-like uncharacterized protein